MRMRLWRGFLVSLGGMVVGGTLGMIWYSLFRSDAGDFLGPLPAIAAGVLAGALAGASLGWWFEEWRANPALPKFLSLTAWIGCGALLVTGTVYIGGWTDSDGPNAEAMVGILGIPAGICLPLMIGRLLARR